MWNEIRNINSSKKELRKFGILFGIISFILGIWFFKEYSEIFIVLGIYFIFGAVVFPLILLPVHKIWMAFAILMGFVIGNIILGILFYFIITPIGLILRRKKDILNRKIDKNKESYWVKTENRENNCEKQY